MLSCAAFTSQWEVCCHVKGGQQRPDTQASACTSLSLSIVVFMQQLILVLSRPRAALGTGR